MKHNFIIKKNSNSLVILFVGWGMDSNPFMDYKMNCDFMVLYDYSTADFDISLISKYSNIYVFAWSFGVYFASKFIQGNKSLPICFKMAINGTMCPIDDKLGIPKAVFEGTYSSLSDDSLLKFYRRICQEKKHYQDFIEHKPICNIDDLKNQLLIIEKDNNANQNVGVKWDKVFIGTRDRIFPSDNQITFWSPIVDTIIVRNEAHLPSDLNKIISDNIVNKLLLKRRFTKVLNEYDSEAVFQKIISRKLHNLWKKTDYRKNTNILELGCGTGFLTNLYASELIPSRLILNDICNIPEQFFKFKSKYEFHRCDAEKIEFLSSIRFDYIVSSSAIQWFENLKGFLIRINSRLSDDGYLIFSTFGKTNMKEIENITGSSLHYYSVVELRGIIEPNYEIISIEEDCEKLEFDSPLDVIRHLKSTGVNSISNNKTWTRADLKKFSDNYPTENGKYRLTYNPIYIIAKKLKSDE